MRGTFKVFRKSENTNSFGLKQYYVINEFNEVYRTHRSEFNSLNIGDTVPMLRGSMRGGELTDFVEDITNKKELLKEIKELLK